MLHKLMSSGEKTKEKGSKSEYLDQHSNVDDDDGGMLIFIKTSNGTLSLDVNLSNTIERLKQKIEKKLGISANEQQLTFAGQLLDSIWTLAECDIHKESTLHLTARQKTKEKTSSCDLKINEFLSLYDIAKMAVSQSTTNYGMVVETYHRDKPSSSTSTICISDWEHVKKTIFDLQTEFDDIGGQISKYHKEESKYVIKYWGEDKGKIVTIYNISNKTAKEIHGLCSLNFS